MRWKRHANGSVDHSLVVVRVASRATAPMYDGSDFGCRRVSSWTGRTSELDRTIDMFGWRHTHWAENSGQLFLYAVVRSRRQLLPAVIATRRSTIGSVLGWSVRPAHPTNNRIQHVRERDSDAGFWTAADYDHHGSLRRLPRPCHRHPDGGVPSRPDGQHHAEPDDFLQLRGCPDDLAGANGQRLDEYVQYVRQ
jgi:hypothetical protein